jgi:hypothetical protein
MAETFETGSLLLMSNNDIHNQSLCIGETRPKVWTNAPLVHKGKTMTTCHRAVGHAPASRPPAARRPTHALRSIASIAAALLLLLAPAAGAEEPTPRSLLDAIDAEGPGSVHATLEDAAVDALVHAHRSAGPNDRGRVLAGTIQRVQGGYRYRAPDRSLDTVWSRRAPRLRLALRAGDVASYVVHPRSGRMRLDRENEAPSDLERAVVDERDPKRRPLFLLTPSLRVVRYADRTTSSVAIRTGQGEQRVASAPPRTLDDSPLVTGLRSLLARVAP